MSDIFYQLQKRMKQRGWDQVDFAYVTGDAYVDHPSFGTAIISRLLESRGYKVGIILSLTGEGRRVFRYLESLAWDFW